MKRQLFLIIIFLLGAVACKTSSISTNHAKVNSPTLSKANTWVFLMAGQSNMAGRGTVEAPDTIKNSRIITMDSLNNWMVAREPLHFYEPKNSGLDCGLSFAREMLKVVPDSVTIAMVPCAVGGSSIFQWIDDREHRMVKLLSNFKEKVHYAKEKGVIKGILWHQGESNANPNDIPVYEEALLELFGIFRAEIGNDTLPIVMGELGRFVLPEEKATNFDGINQIIREVAKENPDLYYVSSQGLDHKGDHLHFSSAAQRELGKRYAKVFSSTIQGAD
ncbi:sialate O-acetylesterase [Echinicola sp. CAU 1574]|uniref:Sialate O-acetylesterase n=1 Tax=Echinicola arenosa TaxID=2774144 RepID=A0ABR9AN62_9BACT|nr:sialate O-acetylesterase [Echinicola arenosa]MBD8489303.1 sialate O-acetylesterase [Echinicola arenosa]